MYYFSCSPTAPLCVTVFDVNVDQNMNVNEDMVNQDLAKYVGKKVFVCPYVLVCLETDDVNSLLRTVCLY